MSIKPIADSYKCYKPDKVTYIPSLTYLASVTYTDEY